MTRHDMLQHVAHRLKQAGIEAPLREARLLLCAALGVDGAQLLSQGNIALSAPEQEKIEPWLKRREQHEPLARIRGARAFWKASFIMNEATLEPRPDSETLVEAAVAYFQNHPVPKNILDLGTGTGCLLLSLLQEFPEAQGVGTDKSPRALEAAQENARLLWLQNRAGFICGNWAESVAGTFDLIVSNPPYIVSKDIAALEPEVRLYDPALALDGGEDGLAAYRALAKIIPPLLAENGAAMLEIGMGQEGDVAKLLESAGLKNIQQKKDLGGVVRVLGFVR